MEHCYKVYMHTFPNGKRYIGITKAEPEDRWKNGRGYVKCRLMNRAIEKHGWENVRHEIIISNLSKEEAESWEIALIAQYHSNERKFGYNIASGGKANSPMSEETKKILSNQRLGKNNPVYGIRGSEHFRSRKINQYKIDGTFIKTWGSGVDIELAGIASRTKVTAVCKRKRKSTGGYQWKYFDGSICNIQPINSKKVMDKLAHEKVIAYDFHGNFVKEYESIEDASKCTGISRGMISNALNNKSYTAGIYQFKYSNNGIFKNKIEECTSIEKPVNQYSKDGVLIATYKNKKEAARATNESYYRIERCIRLNVQVGDYIWKYA